MTTQELIPRQTASMIVEQVMLATTDIQRAFSLLAGAKERLGKALGDGQRVSYNHLWTDRIYDSDLLKTSEQVTRQLEQNAWRYIIDLMGLQAYMTEKRRKELQTQLEQGQFPPLSVDNILSTFTGLVNQVDSLLQESATEVWQWLCPRHYWGTGGLKTNKHWKIGKKVIVGAAVDQSWAGASFHINYYRHDNFRALGNVLSLLDGQGPQHYPDDLTTQLQAALKTVGAGEWVTTPYLQLKPYGNGNAHLQFTRMDLIDKLNALCADGHGLPDTP